MENKKSVVHLMVAKEAPQEAVLASRFGGRPLIPRAATPVWPCCRECKEPMQFLGQLVLAPEKGERLDRLVLLFMCSADTCETWDAEQGANKAMVVVGNSWKIWEPPQVGGSGTPLLRSDVYGVEMVDWEAQADEDGDVYDPARQSWADAHKVARRKVVGQMFGQPSWLQSADDPECPTCGKGMAFIAQLEEGPRYETSMNFGGGSAYVFCCGSHAAKFLWQQ